MMNIINSKKKCVCVLDFIWDCDWYLWIKWIFNQLFDREKKITCMFDFSWNNRAERERETRQRKFKPVELETRAHACHRRCKMFLEKNGGKREKKKIKGEIGNNCASSMWKLELMTTIQCFETHHCMAGWCKNSSTWIWTVLVFYKNYIVGLKKLSWFDDLIYDVIIKLFF
jgi:hypothetical protein